MVAIQEREIDISAAKISRSKNRALYYGWIIMVAGLVMGILGFGIRFSFGVFFNSLETEFRLSRTATSGIYSVYLLICGVLSIFGGWALDKFGPKKVCLVMSLFTGLSLLASSQVRSPWQIYLTYSVLLALGTGGLFVVTGSTVSRWFVKKRGLAVGIISAGGATGGIILSPFATLLISNFNWRIAFIILGVMVWIISIPMSQLMKRDPSDMGLFPDGIKPAPDTVKSTGTKSAAPLSGLLLREALKVREFWFLGAMWLLSGISTQMVLIHTVPYAVGMNISPMDATFVISLASAGNILGRVASGKLSDSFGRKSLAIIGAIIQVIALICLIFVRQTWQFYVVGLVFGIGWGGLNLVIVLIIGDIFGLRSLGAIMGAGISGFSFGSAVGPALGGLVYDMTGSYSGAFALAALGMLIATILGILTKNKAAYPLPSRSLN